MQRDIIVIGGSAGGLDALRSVISRLPKDFPAAIFAVLHAAPNSPGILGAILERAGELPALTVRGRDVIAPGRIYVPAPDHHLLIESGLARATRGPKENRFRPAVDPLFRSAAQSYGHRVIGVILSGGLDDGTAGLAAVKKMGGIAIVQNPEDALAPSMPLNALKRVDVDHCVRISELPSLLVRLAREPVAEKGDVDVPEQIRTEVDIAAERDPLGARHG